MRFGNARRVIGEVLVGRQPEIVSSLYKRNFSKSGVGRLLFIKHIELPQDVYLQEIKDE